MLGKHLLQKVSYRLFWIHNLNLHASITTVNCTAWHTYAFCGPKPVQRLLTEFNPSYLLSACSSGKLPAASSVLLHTSKAGTVQGSSVMRHRLHFHSSWPGYRYRKSGSGRCMLRTRHVSIPVFRNPRGASHRTTTHLRYPRIPTGAPEGATGPHYGTLPVAPCACQIP